MHQLHATHRVVTQILDKLEFTQLLLRQSGGGSVWSHTSNDDWSPKTHKKGFCVYFEIWAFAWPSIILVLQQSRVFDILRGLLCSDQLRSTCNIHILHFCCRIIWKNECIFFSFFIAGHKVWDYIFWSPLSSHPSRVQQQQPQKFLSSLFLGHTKKTSLPRYINIFIAQSFL